MFVKLSFSAGHKVQNIFGSVSYCLSAAKKNLDYSPVFK